MENIKLVKTLIEREEADGFADDFSERLPNPVMADLLRMAAALTLQIARQESELRDLKVLTRILCKTIAKLS